MALNIKQGDYLINDNGDVWNVNKVHRNGDVDISTSVSTGDDELTYTSGQIEAWFRKVSDEDTHYGDREWLDPKEWWNRADIIRPKGKTSKQHSQSRQAVKTRRGVGKSQRTLGGVR